MFGRCLIGLYITCANVFQGFLPPHVLTRKHWSLSIFFSTHPPSLQSLNGDCRQTGCVDTATYVATFLSTSLLENSGAEVTHRQDI
jgi:hypothetical protein